MIGAFLRWWTSELASMLPAGLRGRAATGQWLTVDFSGARLRAVLEGARPRVLVDVPREQRAALEAELASAATRLDPRRVRLRVLPSPDAVLARDLDLPLAAMENLREVLGFEMSRRTPFRAEDVHFDDRVLSRDAAAQRLKLRLEVVPRAQLAPVLDAFRVWSLEPSGEVPHPGDEGVGFRFQAAAFRSRPHKKLNAVLALAAAMLAGVAVWLPLQAQREYRDALADELERARTEAQVVSRLREQLNAEREARTHVTGALAGRASMVELLEGLTRALPDGTYLFRLEVARGEVNLHGSSDAASALIAILEETPYLKGVRFASPVTRDGATARERFHIVAELSAAPGGAGERS